jgi:hypothetical protein
MSLSSYLANGWIARHETSPDEIARLLAIIERDIQQSRIAGLSPEWRFDIAYNAVLQAAVAALAASGYRPERQNKHARAIECLEHTLGVDDKRVRFFDRCRRKRHTAVYEQVGAISSREADELHAAVTRLHTELVAWLRKEHPKLLKKRRNG